MLAIIYNLQALITDGRTEQDLNGIQGRTDVGRVPIER
jgi:hypothetical protein